MSAERLWFLQGPSGVGKSTLLGAAMVPYWQQAGGFTSQRDFNRGQGIRFVLAPLHPKQHKGKKREDGVPVAFLIAKDGKSHFDPSPFEESASQWIEEEQANGTSLFLLDEIGGLEMVHDHFASVLISLFESNAVCLGVFKSEENSNRILERAKLNANETEKYHANRAKLRACIEKNGVLIDVTLSNREQVRKDIDAFLQTHIKNR